MSIAIVGGLDRLKRSYEKKCRDMGYYGKVFSKRVPKLANRMIGVDKIVIFTVASNDYLTHLEKFLASANINIEAMSFSVIFYNNV